MTLMIHQQNFMKIATHDSATGEKGKGLLSIIGSPFARTQSKTIKEQIEAGCRLFDLRIRNTKRGWVCCHGLWQSKKTVDEILSEINSVEGDVYCNITFEDDFVDNKTEKVTLYNVLGQFIKSDTTEEEFMDKIDSIVKTYSHIKFCDIAVKYPMWRVVRRNNSVRSVSKFLALNGTTWHTYLPIPWLWKKIYYDNPIFTNDYFTYVDFL